MSIVIMKSEGNYIVIMPYDKCVASHMKHFIISQVDNTKGNQIMTYERSTKKVCPLGRLI